MTIKASGRSALIIAAGIWACFAGPLQAAAQDADDAAASVSKQASEPTGAPIELKKYTKPRHSKSAQRKSSKVALKSSTDKKPTEADAADNSGANSTAIPPAIANANAQLASADTPIGSARAMSARANNILLTAAESPADPQSAADAQVVAADQLNDLDRALQENNPAQQESKPPAATLAMVSAPARAAPVMARGDDSSTWDQTSLIGKIFIAFGALLTMASAARMFMA
jgi:hypothetical protein